MKKYFFIATAALAALASCSKVTPVAEPDQAISFQVANYASRTKANISILEEGFTTFNTYAWYYDEELGVQPFMKNTLVSADDPSNPTKWAPDRTYYWPKTGHINFYSFAGLTITDNDITEAALAPANAITVDPASSNIIVAKPAMNQTKNTNPAAYGESGASEGVPTLFTHMLAKIKFQVALDATGMGSDFTWDVAIAADQNLMAIPNVGKLSVSYADAGNEPTWTKTTGTANLVSKSVTISGIKNAKSDVVPLTAEFIVMPQADFTALTFSFQYTLKSTHTDGTVISEVVPVSFTMDKFSAAKDQWKYNTVYTYTINIVPNGDPILFDPALEDWVNAEEEGEITVPTE